MRGRLHAVCGWVGLGKMVINGQSSLQRAPWKISLGSRKTDLEPWKRIKTDLEPRKTNLELWKPWKLTWSCTGWLGVVTVDGGYRRLSGESDHFSLQTDKQTLHHNIYISIVTNLCHVFRHDGHPLVDPGQGRWPHLPGHQHDNSRWPRNETNFHLKVDKRSRDPSTFHLGQSLTRLSPPRPTLPAIPGQPSVRGL